MNYEDSLENLLNDRLSIFIGKSQEYLIQLLYVNSHLKNKSSNHLIVRKMLEYALSAEDYERIEKSNYRIKTIRLGLNGKVKESMSFPIINFDKLINQNWVESDLLRILQDEVFIFFVFKYNNDNNLYFEKVIEWKMTIEDIESSKIVWEKAKAIVINGIVIMKTTNGIINNLPKQKDHEILHIRPHARNAKDIILLPDGRELTKQCFWLNSTYIQKIISQTD